MTESTDETLSRTCEHCGKRFYIRRRANQYSKLGKPIPTRYCSPNCRKNASRARHGLATHANSTEPHTALVTPPSPPPESSASPSKPDLSPFDRLRGDAVLSNWKPHVTLETDIPGIPEFLRRKTEEKPEL